MLFSLNYSFAKCRFRSCNFKYFIFTGALLDDGADKQIEIDHQIYFPPEPANNEVSGVSPTQLGMHLFGFLVLLVVS